MTPTWQLWQWLEKPPRNHPLYRRVQENPRPAGKAGGFALEMTLVLLAMSSGGGLLIGRIAGAIFMPIMMVIVAFAASAPLVIAAYFLSGTIYGLLWAVSISGTLAHERQSRRYDLLCLSPGGALGVHQAVVGAHLHRDDHFEGRHRRQLWIGMVMGLGAVLLAIMIADSVWLESGSEVLPTFLITLLHALFIVFAFYFDYLQSIVLGVLVGLVMPSAAPRRLDANTAALGTFLFLQIVVYATTLLVGFVLLPRLFIAINFVGVLSVFVANSLRLLVFLGTREAINAGLWRAISRRMNPVDVASTFSS